LAAGIGGRAKFTSSGIYAAKTEDSSFLAIRGRWANIMALMRDHQSMKEEVVNMGQWTHRSSFLRIYGKCDGNQANKSLENRFSLPKDCVSF
jgi:hypothetical protein